MRKIIIIEYEECAEFSPTSNFFLSAIEEKLHRDIGYDKCLKLMNQIKLSVRETK